MVLWFRQFWNFSQTILCVKCLFIVHMHRMECQRLRNKHEFHGPKSTYHRYLIRFLRCIDSTYMKRENIYMQFISSHHKQSRTLNVMKLCEQPSSWRKLNSISLCNGTMNISEDHWRIRCSDNSITSTKWNKMIKVFPSSSFLLCCAFCCYSIITYQIT